MRVSVCSRYEMENTKISGVFLLLLLFFEELIEESSNPLDPDAWNNLLWAAQIWWLGLHFLYGTCMQVKKKLLEPLTENN